LVPGHEIVGSISELGPEAERFKTGARVGVPWLGWTCGECEYCKTRRENLCVRARFTGYTIDGGYAEYTVADERFCIPVPESYSDPEAAPLLCAHAAREASARCRGAAPRSNQIELFEFPQEF